MAKKRENCVMGQYCPEHKFVHGHEAEELRERFEALLAHGAVTFMGVQRILDEVDARDSLAFREMRPKPILTEKQVQEQQLLLGDELRERFDELVTEILEQPLLRRRRLQVRRKARRKFAESGRKKRKRSA